MRIGLIIYGSLDTVSGGYLYDRKLVEYLRSCGDEVDIISQPWRSYGQHLLQNADFDIFSRIAVPKYDVLLQDELNHPSLFWLNRRLSRLPNMCPIVSIVHHLRCSEQRPSWQNAIYRQIERLYLQSVDGFVFNSLSTYKTVTALVGEHQPCTVAYPAGDRFSAWQHFYHDASSEPDDKQALPLRILFVGNLSERKGLHVLLAALCQLNVKMGGLWSLTVVGNSNINDAYAKQMQSMAEGLKINAYITWLGEIDDASLAQQYANHDIFVMPSQYEGFGIVYLEAMSFGLPVIASSAGAAHEIISTGENGFLVPPENPSALAARLQTLLSHRSRLHAMRAAARKRFEQHPTWAQTTANIRQFLVEMVG
ncbi:MAG: glycosyltransferase family 4 protein [Anaerolineae bacterium]|nr:glycosyltransferase family 4 protein [Anaerolineae bacterium]